MQCGVAFYSKEERFHPCGNLINDVEKAIGKRKGSCLINVRLLSQNRKRSFFYNKAEKISSASVARSCLKQCK